jgi:hypothetical protein
MKLAIVIFLTCVNAAFIGCVIGWLLRKDDRDNGFD